jgi:V/A-type H+-transporting ATPase subunit F
MVDTDTKKQIAVIGNEEFTLGFRLVGVQEVHGMENYEENMQELIGRDDVGIVIAEKNDVQELPKRLQNNVRNSVDPVVVTLSEEATDQNLREQIRQVIGADIA